MSDIILSGASNIVSSDNPMKAGNECFLCILCAADDVENQATLSQYFAPGMVVANSPDKELPVYPSMDNAPAAGLFLRNRQGTKQRYRAAEKHHTSFQRRTERDHSIRSGGLCTDRHQTEKSDTFQ